MRGHFKRLAGMIWMRGRSESRAERWPEQPLRQDVGQRIEVCCAGAVTHPQPFLTCGFETGIVTFTLCPQGVSPFKVEAAAVNGKSVVCWNGLILGAAPVFLPVIPVLVVAGTFAGFGLAERAAVFLAGTPIVGCFAVLVHSKPCLADRITGRKCL